MFVAGAVKTERNRVQTGERSSKEGHRDSTRAQKSVSPAGTSTCFEWTSGQSWRWPQERVIFSFIFEILRDQIAFKIYILWVWYKHNTAFCLVFFSIVTLEDMKAQWDSFGSEFEAFSMWITERERELDVLKSTSGPLEQQILTVKVHRFNPVYIIPETTQTNKHIKVEG